MAALTDSRSLQLIATSAITALLTLIGAWVAFERNDIPGLTADQVRDAVKLALLDPEVQAAMPYPWLRDREMVMTHLNSKSIHEDDTAKRQRIESIMAPHLDLIAAQMTHLQSGIDRIERSLEKPS